MRGTRKHLRGYAHYRRSASMGVAEPLHNHNKLLGRCPGQQLAQPGALAATSKLLQQRGAVRDVLELLTSIHGWLLQHYSCPMPSILLPPHPRAGRSRNCSLLDQQQHGYPWHAQQQQQYVQSLWYCERALAHGCGLRLCHSCLQANPACRPGQVFAAWGKAEGLAEHKSDRVAHGV